jgi:antitoxin (DNA-binding transcriptional repressor) of toxin-antitoxin stability system
MIIVNTHEAKTRLSQLLMEIEKHHEVVRICRNGVAVADIIPIRPTGDPLKQHKKLQKGVKILCDLTEPLTEEDWPQEHR